MKITKATAEDLETILKLQYLAYQSEAELFGSRDIPPLKQTLEEVEEEFKAGVILKMTDGGGTIIGSVRAHEKGGTAYIGKLMVHPDCRGKGFGSMLLGEIERCFPGRRYELFTSTRSLDNIRLYTKLGYKIFDEKKINDELTFVYLEKAPGNPWEEISLDDYEKHMSLDSVNQLQTLNAIMKEQFEDYPVSSVMVLGVAGGNGLEHIDVNEYNAVYGIDINEDYLEKTKARFPEMSGVLDCRRIDLIHEADKLPQAQLVIADLLVEYIGYECFAEAVEHAGAQYVSCVIQINTDTKNWVSDSPYLHAFDRLDEVHHQMEADALATTLSDAGYHEILRKTYPLPNDKALVRIDMKK